MASQRVFDRALSGTCGDAATRFEAVTFDGHFGALHLPAAAPGMAVVLCPPVGRDARCAYRPLFLYAEALARRGFAVLRFDHLGTGDSMPLDPETDAWPLWRAGVEKAAAFARASTGAPMLALAGLRVGASLAALAAPAVRPDALMLLAPIASGKTWVRELQVAASMVGLDRPEDGSVEIDGLRLSRATIASVQQFDLKKIGAVEPRTFLATPASDPRLAAALGPQVTTSLFLGYADLFQEAHVNAPPAALFEAACCWLEGVAAEAPEPAAAPRPLAPAHLSTPEWTELPVTFGAGLRGVLCLPARSAGNQAVIFCNTGGDPRAGIGGFATRASRALAGRGVAALRFDFAGLGESAGPGGWRSHVYETSRTADLCAAADLLARHGYDEPTLAGVCAGGFQALRAAIEDDRFRHVMTINSWLVWRPHAPLELRKSLVPTRRRVNVLALVRPSGWRRLRSGEIQVRDALAILAHRIGRRLSFRRPDPVGRAMRAEIMRICADGARIRVVVGRDDESLDGLEAEFGARGAWLARRRGVAVTTLPGLDHGLFSVESQDMALAEVYRFLGLPGTRGATLWARLRRALTPAAPSGPAALSQAGPSASP